MASKYVQFEGVDGKRKTIRLPGLAAYQVKTVRRHVRALNAARIANLVIEEETARWVSGVNGWLRDKLIEAGLVETREIRPQETLGVFLRDYMINRAALVKSGNLENSTTNIDNLTADCLSEFFGADKALREISEGDA